jgi:hypothetical protein
LNAEQIFERNSRGADASLFVRFIQIFEELVDDLVPSMSESTVLSCCTVITGRFWKRLASLTNPNLEFEVSLNKDDHSGTTVNKCRPDETVHLGNVLVAKGEHKAVNIHDALSELTTKLVDFSELEYGPTIKFLPAYAAAGNNMIFCIIDVYKRSLHVLQQFNLKHGSGRAGAFVASINYFRLLRTMAPYVTELKYATPVFKRHETVTFYPDHVRKEWKENFTAPGALYEILHTGAVPCAVRVEKKSRYLVITPVGTRIPSGVDLSFAELRVAIRCVLECLDFLHEKGFVHRDIRWDNIIRYYHLVDGKPVSCTFKVIDFEYAALNGDAMRIPNYIFGRLVSEGEPYFTHHDMHCVGALIECWVFLRGNCHDQRYEVSAALAFASYLKGAGGPNPSAADALKHEWIVRTPTAVPMTP